MLSIYPYTLAYIQIFFITLHMNTDEIDPITVALEHSASTEAQQEKPRENQISIQMHALVPT